MEKTLRYNFRLNPTPEQETKLIEFGAATRGIWNLLLSETMRRYEYDGTFLFYNDMSSLLKELKVFEEFAWIKAFDSAAAQQVARDLETALKNACSKGRLQRFPKHKISYKRKKLHNDSCQQYDRESSNNSLTVHPVCNQSRNDISNDGYAIYCFAIYIRNP